MRKASTVLLEQGIQTPSPAPDLIPAETSIENLHWHWYSKRGHFNDIDEVLGEQTQSRMTAVGREHVISLHLQQQFPNVE